mgnify:CR=1 FL=1
MKTEEIFASTVLVPPNNGTENCLAIGTRLADFEITGILGEGGFGIVYVAFDHSLQRTVAIKEYMPGTLAGRAADASVSVRAERHKATFEAGLKSFINEARLLAQFDHPSLVKVYRFWEQNKTAYMAMRYYDGKTLKDIVRSRPEMVTEAWLKFIFKQILEALDTLYKAKILHRDVSPDNIIVQKNGDAVLLDFGSARQIIGDMTQGLTVILKPGYAPVEQYADDASLRQGPWTDIYALAAVMYFAILKSPPPTSVARVVKDSLVLLQNGEHPGFSEKFLQAIDIGLAIQPEDRPQTMDEFRRMLGISAFISQRNSRSAGSSSRNASVARDASDTPASSRNKNITRTHSKTRTKPELEEELPTRGRTKPGVLAIALALLVLLGVAIYFSTREKTTGDTPNGNEAVKASASAVLPITPTPSTSPLPAVPSASIALPPASSAANASAVIASSAPEVKPDQEKLDWEALVGDGSIEKLTAFLQKYPDGKFNETAKTRLAELNKAAEASKEEAAPVMFPVKIQIKPWGEVYVDDKKRGLSPPLKKLSLPEGKHKIRFVNPGFPDYVTEIEVGKKKLGTIEHEFTQK